MKKRQLGKTDLSLSEIGLGCWQLGGLTTINGIPITYGNVEESTADKIINIALELGINTFDTADSYSLGNSEKRLGKILKQNRNNINIFTKAGGVPSYNHPLPMEIDLSYHHLMASIDRSLKRLETKYVDLFQAHKAPQSEKDFINIEKAFKEIKSEGKARYCGVSIGLEYDKGIELIERGLVDSIQLYFSLLDFKPIEKLLPLAKKKGVGVIVAEPLSQGFLTGKYTRTHSFPKNDIRSISYDSNALKIKIERSEQFKFLTNASRKLNVVALSYVLSRDEISTCIPGAKSVEQLRSNIPASEIHLTNNDLEQISIIQKKWSNK